MICPQCGTPGAYQSFTAVECVAPSCRAYKAQPAKAEDVIRVGPTLRMGLVTVTPRDQPCQSCGGIVTDTVGADFTHTQCNHCGWGIYMPVCT